MLLPADILNELKCLYLWNSSQKVYETRGRLVVAQFDFDEPSDSIFFGKREINLAAILGPPVDLQRQPGDCQERRR